jgi:hypothetical protein
MGGSASDSIHINRILCRMAKQIPFIVTNDPCQHSDTVDDPQNDMLVKWNLGLNCMKCAVIKHGVEIGAQPPSFRMSVSHYHYIYTVSSTSIATNRCSTNYVLNHYHNLVLFQKRKVLIQWKPDYYPMGMPDTGHTDFQIVRRARRGMSTLDILNTIYAHAWPVSSDRFTIKHPAYTSPFHLRSSYRTWIHTRIFSIFMTYQPSLLLETRGHISVHRGACHRRSLENTWGQHLRGRVSNNKMLCAFVAKASQSYILDARILHERRH